MITLYLLILMTKEFNETVILQLDIQFIGNPIERRLENL